MPQAPFVATQEQRDLVESLAGYGVPQDGIAKMIKISVSTLTRHFAEELELGVLKANAAVSGNLFRIATGDGKAAATAAFFWLKTRARWREVPQEVDVNINDKREITEDERLRAMALLVARQGQSDERRTH